MAGFKKLRKCWRTTFVFFYSPSYCIYAQSPPKAWGSLQGHSSFSSAGLPSQGFVVISKVKLDSKRLQWSEKTQPGNNSCHLWAKLGFLTTSMWNVSTPRELNHPNSSMWVSLMGVSWTQADREQKAPFTGLFTVSEKWNSSFSVFI